MNNCKTVSVSERGKGAARALSHWRRRCIPLGGHWPSVTAASLLAHVLVPLPCSSPGRGLRVVSVRERNVRLHGWWLQRRRKREKEREDLRETLNPKQSWNSSMSRFSRVLLPLPEGPAMTSGAGVRPYWLLAVLFQRTRSGEKEERRLKAGAQLWGSLPVLAARARGRLAGSRLRCSFSFWVPTESIFRQMW